MRSETVYGDKWLVQGSSLQVGYQVKKKKKTKTGTQDAHCPGLAHEEHIAPVVVKSRQKFFFFFLARIRVLVHRWRKCNVKQGDYIENNKQTKQNGVLFLMYQTNQTKKKKQTKKQQKKNWV